MARRIRKSVAVWKAGASAKISLALALALADIEVGICRVARGAEVIATFAKRIIAAAEAAEIIGSSCWTAATIRIRRIESTEWIVAAVVVSGGSAISTAASTAATRIAGYMLQFWIYILIGLPQDLYQGACTLRIFSCEKCVGCACGMLSPSATNAMYIVLRWLWKIKINDILNAVHVEAACRHIGGHQNVGAAAPKVIQNIVTIHLGFVAMYGADANAKSVDKPRQLVHLLLSGYKYYNLPWHAGLVVNVWQQVLQFGSFLVFSADFNILSYVMIGWQLQGADIYLFYVKYRVIYIMLEECMEFQLPVCSCRESPRLIDALLLATSRSTLVFDGLV